MRINKIVETCIYSSDLDGMKKFYVGILGLQPVQEEKGKLIFLQAGKSMLLIFDPARTTAGCRRTARRLRRQASTLRWKSKGATTGTGRNFWQKIKSL